jgi:methionyl-tRNA formyltransferase
VRLVFCGTPDIAVPSLAALAERPGWEIAAVLTQPDRPAGRGRTPRPSPVSVAAAECGLRTLTPERLKDVRPLLEELAPDAIAVVAYGHIFRRWLLELPRLGCVNVHFSLLPRHRGVAPVQWAILEGDSETGVTTMCMDRGVDTGPVLLTERVPILPEDTAGSLLAKLATVGGPLLARSIEELASGRLVPQAQPEEGATYARRLEKEDGRIDWTHPAEEIGRRVRGLSPWPGAFTTWRGEVLKVHTARPVVASLAPGRLACEGRRVMAGTGDGALELMTVQAQGKARMEGEAWWRGARPEPGERLGGNGE